MARVLIIEQSATVRELIATIVGGLGHEPLPLDPETATEVPDADLVLVAPELPRARRLVALIRARSPGVPVVAVTGGPEELASLTELGPVFPLAKPFGLDELREAITHALDGAVRLV